MRVVLGRMACPSQAVSATAHASVHEIHVAAPVLGYSGLAPGSWRGDSCSGPVLVLGVGSGVRVAWSRA